MILLALRDIHKKYVGLSITLNGLTPLVAELMGSVQNLKLSGSEKKRTVLNIIDVMISNAPNLSPEEKQSMKNEIENIMPHIIDAIIALMRSKKLIKAFAKSNCKICF